MRYLFIALCVFSAHVGAKTAELECQTERTFDAEDYGVTGDPSGDNFQSFNLSIDMEYAKAAMQGRTYRDVVLSPTVVMMEHVEGPGSDGKIYLNTTEVDRDTLKVSTALFMDNREYKRWSGACALVADE